MAATAEHKSHHFGNSSPPAPNKGGREARPSSSFVITKGVQHDPGLCPETNLLTRGALVLLVLGILQ